MYFIFWQFKFSTTISSLFQQRIVNFCFNRIKTRSFLGLLYFSRKIYNTSYLPCDPRVYSSSFDFNYMVENNKLDVILQITSQAIVRFDVKLQSRRNLVGRKNDLQFALIKFRLKSARFLKPMKRSLIRPEVPSRENNKK